MDILKTLYDEVIGFFGFQPLIEMYQKDDYSSLRTLNGVFGAISPFIPSLLIWRLVPPEAAYSQ